MPRIQYSYTPFNGISIADKFEPETFGRLTTIGPRFMLQDSGGRRYAHQVCECSCGTIGVYSCSQMRGKNTSSCGCFRKENSRSLLLIHGEGVKSTPEHTAWKKIRERCLWPGCKEYPRYGGRGIKICDRWNNLTTGLLAFIEDMGRKPTPKHSIDRIDNDGDYCPENCRWATPIEQARNKRNNRYITAFGKTKLVKEFAEEYGIDYKLLHSRIQKGWDIEKAITTPSRTARDKKNT